MKIPEAQKASGFYFIFASLAGSLRVVFYGGFSYKQREEKLSPQRKSSEWSGWPAVEGPLDNLDMGRYTKYEPALQALLVWSGWTMKFLVKMTYEKEDYEAFVHLAGKVIERGKTIAIRVFFLILAVAAVFFGIVMFLSDMDNNETMGAILLIVGVVAACRSIFHYPLQLQQLTKNQKTNLAENSYTFKNDTFVLENDLGVREYGYDKLYHVVESQDHLFLMMNESSALVLPKKSVLHGSPKALREFLEEKTGKKVQQITL